MGTTNKQLWTATEAGEFLRRSTQSVLDMANAGKLPAKLVGKRWRFDPEQLREWVRNNK